MAQIIKSGRPSSVKTYVYIAIGLEVLSIFFYLLMANYFNNQECGQANPFLIPMFVSGIAGSLSAFIGLFMSFRRKKYRHGVALLFLWIGCLLLNSYMLLAVIFANSFRFCGWTY